MDTALIARLCDDNRDLVKFLVDKGEVTFASNVSDNFKRTLVLAIASFFEYEISEIIIKAAQAHSQDSQFIESLIRNKVLARQYHTFFDWDRENANKFYSMFGDVIKDRVKIIATPEVLEGTKNFLDLGRTRNSLVHGNFASYEINKTVEDIMLQFSSACKFVEFARVILTEKTTTAEVVAEPVCD